MIDSGKLYKELVEAAEKQDEYDLMTVNLIAPATPTPLKYFYNLPLKHNDIAEGLLNNRPYAGAKWFNKIESITADLACHLFKAEHANVQPHSVSQANQAVYQALLKNGDKVLAMKFCDGGHLTHGMKMNFSGRFFDFSFYGVGSDGLIDYDQIEEMAKKIRPKMIVCGASSYPRKIDFKRLREICDLVGAYLLGDLCHPAGLIAVKKFPQPFPYCDVVTLTLDKTLLGPHGGIILCKKSLAKKIDQGVHPGVQSSVPLRRIFEMGMCLVDVSKPWYRNYIDRLMRNMKTMEKIFSKYREFMITGGTDTHLMVINTLKTFNLTGQQAEELLEKIGILTNRQVVPGETLKPYVASGLRLGAAWITARGYSEDETSSIAKIILANLEDPKNLNLQEESRKKLAELLKVKRKRDVWYE